MTDRCEPPEHLREKDGWHWLIEPWDDGKEYPLPVLFIAPRSPGIEPLWRLPSEVCTPSWTYQLGFRYIAPVADPAQVAALEAENRRLREALESIATAVPAPLVLPWTHEAAADKYWGAFDHGRMLARAALEPFKP